uniref:Malic enzyme N-terminal domain-containing protein n=1 Tax=Daucus carota subsp. sativus TaxID=79200 RepID=A0A161XRA2_DAUCS|nr:PREDICTED: NADP-dependent malic enzyme-like [Daucus carota subsp. sativus]
MLLSSVLKVQALISIFLAVAILALQKLRSYEVLLHRYIAMMELQERNERLFYKIFIDNVEELLPVVYTPTVGDACQK